jgi:hypothetical protein
VVLLKYSNDILKSEARKEGEKLPNKALSKSTKKSAAKRIAQNRIDEK